MSALERQRPPRRKARTIKVKWGTIQYHDPDLVVDWGEGCYKADARYVVFRISEIAKEMEQRGYDQRTIRFEIKLKPTLLL